MRSYPDDSRLILAHKALVLANYLCPFRRRNGRAWNKYLRYFTYALLAGWDDFYGVEEYVHRIEFLDRYIEQQQLLLEKKGVLRRQLANLPPVTEERFAEFLLTVPEEDRDLFQRSLGVQSSIAKKRGCNQSTISRKIKAYRKGFKKRLKDEIYPLFDSKNKYFRNKSRIRA